MPYLFVTGKAGIAGSDLGFHRRASPNRRRPRASDEYDL